MNPNTSCMSCRGGHPWGFPCYFPPRCTREVELVSKLPYAMFGQDDMPGPNDPQSRGGAEFHRGQRFFRFPFSWRFGWPWFVSYPFNPYAPPGGRWMRARAAMPVRTEPRFDAPILSRLVPGQRVLVLETNAAGWARVSPEGWVCDTCAEVPGGPWLV